jgi:hypothetical protein
LPSSDDDDIVVRVFERADARRRAFTEVNAPSVIEAGA